MMPQVDGWEMLRGCRSGTASGRSRSSCSAARSTRLPPARPTARGAQGFIGKPFDPQQLIERRSSCCRADPARPPPRALGRPASRRLAGLVLRRPLENRRRRARVHRRGRRARGAVAQAVVPVLLVTAALARGRPLARATAVDRPRAPAARLPGAEAARARAAHRLASRPATPRRASRARRCSRLRRRGWRVPLFVLAALIAWSRVYVGVHYPLDVLAGAAPRACAGRYSSSAARSSPADDYAQRGQQADPDADPAAVGGEDRSGIEISRIRTKIVASAPSAITTRLSGTAGGSSKPASRSATSSEHGEADEEDELAEHARVPADHAERRARRRSPRTSP